MHLSIPIWKWTWKNRRPSALYCTRKTTLCLSCPECCTWLKKPPLTPRKPSACSEYFLATRKTNQTNGQRESRNGLTQGRTDNETPFIVLLSAESAVKLQISNVTSHDQRRRLYLGVKPYTGSFQTLQYHGHVQENIINLIVLALKLLDRLSFLFRYPSQYSHFVPKYLTLIGIGHYCYFDDCERVLLIAEGQGAAEIFLNLFEKHKNSDSVYVWKSSRWNEFVIWIL